MNSVKCSRNHTSWEQVSSTLQVSTLRCTPGARELRLAWFLTRRHRWSFSHAGIARKCPLQRDSKFSGLLGELNPVLALHGASPCQIQGTPGCTGLAIPHSGSQGHSGRARVRKLSLCVTARTPRRLELRGVLFGGNGFLVNSARAWILARRDRVWVELRGSLGSGSEHRKVLVKPKITRRWLLG